MKRTLIYVTALTAGVALISVAGAFGSLGKAEKACAGNLCFVDNGGISPSVLPKHEQAPITARILGKIRTRDGSHPPAVQSVSADVDRTIGIDAVGLPTCGLGQLVARTTAEVKTACRSAIVGAGTAEVEVAFPEQLPFSATGPVVLFNGGVHGGATTVFAHAYINVPAPTAVVTKATITRIHRGRFGHHLEVNIPKIAGGAGSPTAIDLKIGRKFTYKGQKKSFLTASCPTGHWMTKGEVQFSDETRVSVSHLFSCTPKG